MAKNLHNSSDLPDFDTYPSTPPPSADPIGYHVPEKSSLEQRAADLGAAAGNLVAKVRQARESLGNLPSHPVFDRVGELAEDVRGQAEHLRSVTAQRAMDLKQAARDKTIELRSQVQEKTANLGRLAKSNFYRARLRANQTVREYPVHVALAAGTVGFLAGVALRIRRANRA